MKKYFKSVSLLVLAFIIAIMPMSVQASGIGVTVDGVPVQFSDVQPVIVDDRTLVPLREVFEAMGFTVAWDEETSTAALDKPGYNVTVTIGDDFIVVNDRQYYGDVPPQIVEDRFMLPLRLISEAVGADVDWDGSNVTITVRPAVPLYEPVPDTPTPPDAGWDMSLIPEFLSFSGTVAEIREDGPRKFVMLENPDLESTRFNFVVDYLTVLVFEGEIEIGMELTGFYDTNLPVPMIYPPQHHAKALVGETPSGVTMFRVSDIEGNVLSNRDSSTVVLFNDEAEFVFQDGRDFEGEFSDLQNRTLLVFYDIVAASYPPQIIPTKIIVLFERMVHPIQ